jgi:hypothetical protein
MTVKQRLLPAVVVTALTTGTVGLLVGHQIAASSEDEHTQAEIRACQSVPAAAARVDGAAVADFRAGLFTPTALDVVSQSVDQMDLAVSTKTLGVKVYAALNNVGTAYAALNVLASGYAHTDSYNSIKLDRRIQRAQAATVKATEVCVAATDA